ncbi:zinc finger protein 239-like isoform X1 [Acanthochromis polyacanthus]|uniref:zinc finger protein 239-like isoform X1 n=1 Tax=Acanthochromis polyacanthus TaxID=80966 RepID=UPI000B8F998F|nr:zinc finger protein 239-like isoform X1 [Acanthochromis polyacanthus]
MRGETEPVKLEEEKMKQQQTATDVQQLLMVKEEFPAEQQNWCPGLDQDDPPDVRQIKEEQEKLWTCQVEELPAGPVPVKSEDDEGQQLCRATQPPDSSLTQHMKTEFDEDDLQGSESHLQDTIKTSHSSESETEDSDGYWEELRDPQLDLNALNNSVIPLNNLGDGSATKSYSCSDCEKRFTHKGTMQRHKRCHTGEKPFSCTTCGTKMARYDQLIGHMRCHSGEKPFSCSVCKKKFRLSGDVASHMRVHTGETPYRCSLCGRRFRQSSSLRSHLKSHNEERPLGCSVCSRRFHRRTTLVSHMRTHTGEKPYRCTVCGTGFSQAGALKRHERIHSGEKPYCCTVCGKGFSQAGALKRHERIHTREKPYSCGKCGERFRQQTHVTNHKCVAQNRSSS